MIRNVTISVSGKVQGVFYRASAAEKASLLSLNGFVTNLPDGSVLIEAEGEEHSLNALIEWAKQGPPRAVVTDCGVKPGEVKNYTRFEIKR